VRTGNAWVFDGCQRTSVGAKNWCDRNTPGNVVFAENVVLGEEGLGVSNTATNAGRDGGEPFTETVSAVTGTGPPLTGIAAGVTGAVLVVAGVWGLHVLIPGGGVTGSVGWVLLLLASVRRVG
jgi:hypothetical protein